MLNIQTINVDLTTFNSSYSILIGVSATNCLTKCIPENTGRVVIISDNNVAALYAYELQSYLVTRDYSVEIITFMAGESSKNREVKAQIEDQMLELELDRTSLVIALGGGVVGDMAGFIAATYMRGVNLIQMPTSLLAMLDSSVGGKTGVNTNKGKNLIGAFYQPLAVICDLSYLKTLPKSELINGFFEAIKIFLTLDAEQFEYASIHLSKLEILDYNYISQVVHAAVKLKAMVVMQDEKESNFRMILNFGHSVGHGLEKLSNYSISHGVAVGIGMLVEARVAVLLGELSYSAFEQISALLLKLIDDLIILKGFSPESIIEAMRNDKKNQHGTIKIVLLNEIGGVKNINQQVAFGVHETTIRQAISDVCSL